MKNVKIYFLRSRAGSFRCAWEGILAFFRNEPNARIHFAATLLVILLCLLFPVSGTEAAVLALATGFVWAAELFNTAVERMMDFISHETDPNIRFIKDVSAGAVLLSAASALITGALIFIPKLMSL